MFNWRKLEREGALTAVTAGESVVPASELAAARSHVAQLLVRPADWIDGRTTQTFHQPADAILVDAVRAEIAALPTLMAIAGLALWSTARAP